MPRCKVKEPIPTPGLAEFVAGIANGNVATDADVLNEYRKQWMAAHASGDVGMIPTHRSVSVTIGIPSRTVGNRADRLVRDGVMVRVKSRSGRTYYVPDEPEFTSALPDEEDA
jgi:hypothetical protein